MGSISASRLWYYGTTITLAVPMPLAARLVKAARSATARKGRGLTGERPILRYSSNAQSRGVLCRGN